MDARLWDCKKVDKIAAQESGPSSARRPKFMNAGLTRGLNDAEQACIQYACRAAAVSNECIAMNFHGKTIICKFSAEAPEDAAQLKNELGGALG